MSRRTLLASATSAVCAIALSAHAGAPPERFSMQGVLQTIDGTPLEASSVQMRVQIRSADGACLLFEEHHVLDLRGSGGRFDLSIGAGQQERVNAPAFSLAQVVSNRAPFEDPRLACTDNRYTPLAQDGRQVRIYFDDGNGEQRLMPDRALSSVPYAMVAGELASGATLQVAEFSAACDAGSSGTLRFSSGRLLFCDGGGWKIISTSEPIPQLVMDPRSVNGMDITAGSSPGALVSFTVTNLSFATTAPLVVNLSSQNNFEIGSDTCSASRLTSGETCEVQVRPRATDNGSYSATLSVGHSGTSVDASLSGTASGFGCPTDQYLNGGVCTHVGTGFYSPDSSTQRFSCTNKPANSRYTSSGNGSNNCNWTCDSGFQQSGNFCIDPSALCNPSLSQRTYSNPRVRGIPLGAGTLAGYRAFCAGQGYCNQSNRSTAQYNTVHNNNPPGGPVSLLNLHPECQGEGQNFPQTAEELAQSGTTNNWCNYSESQAARGQRYNFIITSITCRP